MSMNSPHESVKEIVGDVWKNNKPLAIAVLVVVGVVIYVLYKRSQSSLIVTPSTATTPTGAGSVYNNTYTTITKTVTGQPPVVSAPPPPAVGVGTMAIIRLKQSSGIDKAWDSGHTGVPVRAQPSGSANVVRLAPFGSSITVLQAALTAAPNQRGGSSQWYPVTGGYLSAWDIASIK